MTYDPTFLMPTPMLVPSTIWMELKCKQPNVWDSTRRRDKIIVYQPRAPYQTIYEPDRYKFIPVLHLRPEWKIIREFIPGSYVLEGFTSAYGGESLFMWDIAGQENYRPGEQIIPDVCTAPRNG